MSLLVSIIRRRASYQYKRNPDAPAAWDNNDANNSLDSFSLYEGTDLLQLTGRPVFSCIAQTVSNCEGLVAGMRFWSTIAPGRFDLRAFVHPGSFYGRIHGLCNCRTIGGDKIGPYMLALGYTDRWLDHDWQFKRPKLAGQDTRVAWSGGCFLEPDFALVRLGIIFDRYGIKPGDLVPGQLIEEG